jgi:hypothetical protein
MKVKIIAIIRRTGVPGAFNRNAEQQAAGLFYSEFSMKFSISFCESVRSNEQTNSFANQFQF